MAATRYFWFYGDRLLLDSAGEYLHAEPPPQALFRLPVSRPEETTELWLCALDEQQPAPDGFQASALRPLLANVAVAAFGPLARAAQLHTWHRNHQFCSRCGAPTRQHDADLARHCDQCHYQQYPRISPCIIVLIRHGERCLLAHAAHFGPGRYSTLAGFIEAGESAEEAVVREVREEVGIEVTNIRYARSQSWPFPHSLMLGFYADYAGGEIRPDGIEILDARWFSAEQLPELPPPFTISRQLIDGFLKQADGTAS